MLSLEEQYYRVRHSVGCLDRSRVGKLAIRGKDRFTWLQGMVSADTRLLAEGKTEALPACILNATGHLLTDANLVAVRGEDPYILIDLPLENLMRIATVLDRFLITEDVEIADISDHLACLSFQGPRALAQWEARKEALQAIPQGVARAASDHTGEGGWDWYGSAEEAEALRTKFFPEGCIEWEAQETLRVEAGIPRFGIDMDETVIALEANLGPTHISMTKGCYVGQEIIARIDSRGHTNRALTGLLCLQDTLPAFGDKLFLSSEETNQADKEVGRITSVIARSPRMKGQPIALGYVRHEAREPGTVLTFGAGASKVQTVTLPFRQ